MKKYWVAIFIFVFAFSGHAQKVESLRVETCSNPLGIENPHPSLSWIISDARRNVIQEAYQVQVASSLDKLFSGKADLWNSGKVKSNQSTYISYNGTAMKSGLQCFWRVKVWTNKGETEWSPVSKWSMGLLSIS